MLITFVGACGWFVPFVFGSEAYKSGEYDGYSLHNESVYNESILCVNYNLEKSFYGSGPRDIYYQAYGYTNGYEKWADEMYDSEISDLLEIE